MNEEQKIHLTAVIEHYQKATVDREVSLGPDDCELCKFYRKARLLKKGTQSVDCTGCPIYETTKQHGCHGTPFYVYSFSLDEVRGDYSVVDEDYFDLVANELEFLNDLLERQNSLEELIKDALKKRNIGWTNESWGLESCTANVISLEEFVDIVKEIVERLKT